MPDLTRWYIKSALIFFVAALLVGLALALNGLLQMPPFIVQLGPVYFHMFLVGWVTQLIFGVVYWMFPKFSPQKPRGNEFIAWASFWLLNGGLLLRVFGEPANALNPGSGWGWILAVSALAQWVAGLLFVANTWTRVKER